MSIDSQAYSSHKKRISVYCVYFDASKRVLLVKDANSLQWGFPGGGLESRETRHDALHREFTEETGLLIHGRDIYIAYQEDDARQRYFYRITGVKGNLKEQGNSDDILEAAYFAANNLPSDLAPGVDQIILQQLTLQP